MSKTSAYVHMPLYDTTIKADASFSCTSTQPFSNPSDLSGYNICSKLATFEPDYWVLDGGNKLAPEAGVNRVGLISGEQSGADGTFSAPPVLTVTFGSAHSIDGITLSFAGSEWASEVFVEYYNASNVLISDNTYYPTGKKFYTGEAVVGVKRIVIEFISTNNPYRFLRLENIDFGRVLDFSGNELKRAVVVEEISPTSIESPHNTFDFEVLSSTELLSLIDAAVDSEYPVDAYELVDGVIVYMGRFYLSEWEQSSGSRVKISCVDKLAKLERETYYGMIFYDSPPYTIGGMVANMAYNVGFEYTIDPDISAVTFIYAGMYYTNVRDALQKMAMAAGGYVTCSRSGTVDIKKIRYSSGDYDSVILNSEKKVTKPAKLRAAVSDVSVVSSNFNRDRDAVIVTEFDSVVSTGEMVIVYNNPGLYSSAAESTATFTPAAVEWYYPGSGRYMNYRTYYKINVTLAGRLIFEGQRYVKSQQTHNITGSGGNVIRVNGNEFVSLLLGPATAQRIYDYYQQRNEFEFTVFGVNLEPGATLKTEAVPGEYFYGVIERIETNMTSGFSMKIKSVGSVSGIVKMAGADDGAGAYGFAGNYINLNKYTANYSGLATEIRIKCNSPANVKVGIYSDNSGSPNALLVSTASTPVVAGWNTISIPETALVSGQDYWLVFNQDTLGAVCVSDTGGTTKYKSLSMVSGFPNPAGAGYTDWTGKTYIAVFGYR